MILGLKALYFPTFIITYFYICYFRLKGRII